MDYLSLNGQLLPYEDARIAPSDAGFLHGAGLFETMRVKNKKIFRLADHLARLHDSAQILNLPVSLTAAQITELTEELLEANDLTDARLRLTVTRGDLHSIDAENPTPPVTLLLTAARFDPYPADLYTKGMTVTLCPYKQNSDHPLTGHKTTSYFDRLLGLQHAHRARAGESLWFTPGTNYLAEGSISNIFLVDKEGILATPPTTLSPQSSVPNPRLCLPGITRKLTLQLATQADILPHERLLTINDLLSAKEVFLTNAIMGLMPVTHIEQHTVADGTSGPMTRALLTAYQKTVDAETT